MTRRLAVISAGAVVVAAIMSLSALWLDSHSASAGGPVTIDNLSIDSDTLPERKVERLLVSTVTRG